MGVINPKTGAHREIKNNLGEFLDGNGDPIALHERITDQNTAIQTIDDEIAVIDGNVDDIKAIGLNPTHGFAALQQEHEDTQAALQTVDDEVGAIAGDVTTISDAVTSAAHGNAQLLVEINENEALLNNLSTAVNNLSEMTGVFHLDIDDTVALPETGTKWVPYTIVHRGANGQIDLDGGIPVVSIHKSDGTSADALLYSGQTAPASRIASTSPTKISDGYFRGFLLLATTTDIDNYNLTATGTHETNPLLSTGKISIAQVVEDNFTTTDRDKINDTNTKVTEIQNNVDAIDAELDTVREKTGGSFDRDLHSLEALRAALDAGFAAGSGMQPFRLSGVTTAIADSGTLTLALDVGKELFNLKNLTVTRATGACAKFDVYVYEDSGETIEILPITSNRPNQDDMHHSDDIIIANQDSPSTTTNVYVKIINQQDTGSSTFNWDLRGLR